VDTKCWDQRAEGCLIPNMEKCEGFSHSTGDNKCTGFQPRGIPGGLFIGVVRGFGNNVQIAP
jgi:hypothetical protein